MKTANLAIMTVSAALLAVGCGSETGQDGSTAVSSASLSVGSAADLTSVGDIDPGTGGVQLPPSREFPASCFIIDNNTLKVLVVGGFTSAAGNAGLLDAYLYNPSADTWSIAASLAAGEGRGKAKLIPVPGTTNKCVLVGGQSAKATPATRKNTFVFTTNGGTGAWATAGALTDNRIDFGASACGTQSNTMVVGGQDEMGNALDSIEIWNGAATWTKQASPIRLGSSGSSKPRHSSGFSAQGTEKFIVTGGHDGAAASKQVDIITADDSCSNMVVTTFATKLNSARYGGVAFKTGTVDHFLVTGGDTGAALLTDEEDLTVTWTGTPAVAVTTHATMITGSRYPTLAPGSGGLYLLIGGEGHTGTPITAVQEYVSVNTAFTTSNLATARVGAAAELLNDVFVFTGRTGAATWATSTEKVTP